MKMNAPEPLRLRVLRSSQTDAEQLDDELFSLFSANLNRCLGVFHSAWFTGHYRELLLALQSVIFGLTVGRGRPSPGMSLLNLRYRDERPSMGNRNEGPRLAKMQRILLYLGNIVMPYAWAKVMASLVQCADGGRVDSAGSFLDALSSGISGVSGSSGDKENHEDLGSGPSSGPLRSGPLRSMSLACRLALGSFAGSSASGLLKTMSSLEMAWKALELANYVVYLRDGAYRGALDRIIGARLVYGDVRASRHVSFDYLNRQLIWSEVSDFVLFVLPLLHIGSVGRFVNKYLPMNESIRGSGTIGADVTCPVCETTKESPVRCQAIPCRHMYCYYCFASRLGTSADPRCYVCSVPVRHVRLV